jgi:protein required for attachment to host cells
MEETDWHRLEEARFADGLAEMLYARAHRARFQRLILAASPRVLGELRRVLHKEVSDRVVGEVPLTLTNHPVNEMAHRIADALTPPEAE